MIKALIFDLDNTLYDEKSYFLEVFRIFAKKYKLDFEFIKELLSDDFFLKSKDIFGDVLKKIGCYSVAKQNELFELYKTIDCKLDLYSEAYKIFDFAIKKNISLAIVTNGVLEAQKNKVKVLKLEKFTNCIIYAREFGKEYEKPHPLPFIKAIKCLKVNTSEAIYIGDHPFTDIKGAKKVGLKAIRFLNGYAKYIDYNYNLNIESLIEIKKFL